MTAETLPFVFSLLFAVAFGFGCGRLFRWIDIQLIKQDLAIIQEKVNDPIYPLLSDHREWLLTLGCVMFTPAAGMLIVFPSDEAVQGFSIVLFGYSAFAFYLADKAHTKIRKVLGRGNSRP